MCEIIVVDDDPEFSSSLADLLELEGHNADTFATPEDAFDFLLSAGRADLVLLDLRTPGISAQRFRALLISAPELHDQDLVIISGDPQVHTIAAGLGIHESYKKPLDVERLLATVSRHCRHDHTRPRRAP